MSAVDYTGQRFGALVAVEPTPGRRRGAVLWRWRCDCGRTCERTASALRTATRQGDTPSCGRCRTGLACAHAVDLAGRRFGLLVVVEPAPTPPHGQGLHWRCACDCGGSTVARGKDLRLGNTTSCGCARLAKRKPDVATRANPRIQPGDTFGRLTVRAFAGIRNGYRYWRCDCACGGETETRTALLRRGQTRSCGCLRSDVGALRAERRGEATC